MTWMLLLLMVQTDPKPIAPEKVAQFQKALESTVFSNLPTPLYEGKSHWGDTAEAVNGIKWKPKPELQYTQKNQGTWRKYQITLQQPASDHLKLEINDMKNIGNNTLQFELLIKADLIFDVTQQNWSAGIKLFDGSARGSAKVRLRLTCESKLVIEPSTSYLPTIRYRLRVSEAKASYIDLQFKHVPGFGGSAAKVIGEWTFDAVNQLKPSIERKLIDKLSQKVVKAADTKEIQLSLAGIERKKK
jgi:hypothetical protein